MSPADSPFAPLTAPGPHPATAELRAYAAGTLPAAEQHRIEAHTLDCERCADLLDGFSMTDAATTDQGIVDLRARLEVRLATEPPRAAGRPVWPRLAAAAALLGVVAGGLWGWEQRTTSTSPATAHVKTAPSARSERARLESASSASAPESDQLAESAAAPPQPSAPPTGTPTPKASKPAEYAVVTPRQSQERPMAIRRERPASRADADPPARREAQDLDREAVASSAPVDAAEPVTTAETTESALSQPAKNAAPATGSVAAAGPAKKNSPEAETKKEAEAKKDIAATKAKVAEKARPADTVLVAQGATMGKRAKAKTQVEFASRASGTSPATAPAGAVADDAADAASAPQTAAPMPAATPISKPAAPARVAGTPMPVAPAIAPAPVGGWPALRDYLSREAADFVPEPTAVRRGGNVRIQFVVGADGKLRDLKVTRSLRADYDAEALRLLTEGPAWQPGVAGGRRAPLLMEVTVPF